MSSSNDATGLLQRWSNGEQAALDELVAMLFEEMHRIAARQMRSERGITVQPTSLVNEVYLRLRSLGKVELRDRGHFLAVCSRIARRTLVDEARKRNANKRDGGDQITINGDALGTTAREFGILEVDQMLQQLETYDADAARVVELRIFGGLNIEEAASELAISEATVSRKWRAGKAWLAKELKPN